MTSSCSEPWHPSKASTWASTVGPRCRGPSTRNTARSRGPVTCGPSPTRPANPLPTRAPTSSTSSARSACAMSDRLRLGLVQCGSIMPALAERHGDYPLLFERLLAPFDVEITTWDVRTGAPMPGVADQDGWLVSGSASSTYDDLPWIPVAESFLRGAVEASSPLVG